MISTSSAASVQRRRTRDGAPFACLSTLVSASWTIRYAATETPPEIARGSPLTRSSTALPPARLDRLEQRLRAALVLGHDLSRRAGLENHHADRVGDDVVQFARD